MKSKTRKIYLIGLSFGLLVMSLTILPSGTVFNRTASAQVQKNESVTDSVGEKFAKSLERRGPSSLMQNIYGKPLQTENLLTTPIITEFQEVTSSDGTEFDFFSRNLSIDGDRAIIGGYGNDNNGNSSGAAYIFSRSGATWSEGTKLIPDDATTPASFGYSVALEGDVAVIGATGDSSVGAAYIFLPSGQQAKLTASDAGQFDALGWSVAISGNTAVVGAIRNDNNGKTDSGAVYVYTRNGTVWSEQAKLTASDADDDDLFGISVAIDGDTVFVGASNNDDAGSNSGSAYIFTRSGTIWTEQAKLTAFDAASEDIFGVVLAMDGDTAVIGSWDDDDTATDSGSAYVYRRSAGSWSLEQKLTASDAEMNDRFGHAVDIDGNTIAIGAGVKSSITTRNAGYVFRRNGSTWTEFRKMVPGIRQTLVSSFARTIGVSGTTVIIGDYFKDVPSPLTEKPANKYSNLAGSRQGSAYFYNLLAPTAANASISGRVMTSKGSGIPSVSVHINDQSGNFRTATTNSFGYYRFDNIEAGQTLIFSLYNKQYSFDLRVVNFDDSLTDLNFTPR